MTSLTQNRIIGFFHSCELPWDATEDEERAIEEKREVFARYLSELDKNLRNLRNTDYGTDLELILFQFELFPNKELALLLRNVEYYRPKEKSIGLNIIIKDDNFYSKSHNGRISFLNQSILERIGQLKQRFRKKSLDTDVDKLYADISRILNK